MLRRDQEKGWPGETEVHTGSCSTATQSISMSKCPGHAGVAGGRIDRGAPCYGEDNEYVYGELLGMTKREIADLAAEGVF